MSREPFTCSMLLKRGETTDTKSLCGLHADSKYCAGHSINSKDCASNHIFNLLESIVFI